MQLLPHPTTAATRLGRAMKRPLLLVPCLLMQWRAAACPECQKRQPKILRGITHGAGPEDNWDYVIVWTVAAIVVVTLFFSIKWLIRPGEKSVAHIKLLVLNND